MINKSNLHKAALKTIITDVVKALREVKRLCPDDNVDLIGAVDDVFDVLDEYSKPFFQSGAIELTDDLEDDE